MEKFIDDGGNLQLFNPLFCEIVSPEFSRLTFEI